MKKYLKKYRKDSMNIAATGIGLSALSYASPDANTSSAIGKFSKGLNPISSLSIMNTTLGMVKKIGKKR